MSGVQISVKCLSFFNAKWSGRLRIAFILFITASYSVLYTFFKTPETIRLTPFFYYFLYISSAIMTVALIVSFINYFVQSTDRAETSLKQANLKLSTKNTQIEKTLNECDKALSTLGRELSEAADYVRTILPDPMRQNNIRTDWRFIPSASLKMLKTLAGEIASQMTSPSLR